MLFQIGLDFDLTKQVAEPVAGYRASLTIDLTVHARSFVGLSRALWCLFLQWCVRQTKASGESVVQ